MYGWCLVWLFRLLLDTVKGFKLHVLNRLKRKNAEKLTRSLGLDKGDLHTVQCGITKHHTWKK